MRQLEQRQRQAEQRQAERQHSVDRCKDLMQRNESALQQLRVASESATARQEQQLDNLQATLHMLESRLTTLTPRFEEIAELRARNEALQRRLAEATAQRSGEGAGAGDAAVPRGESGETRDARDGAGGESEDATGAGAAGGAAAAGGGGVEGVEGEGGG